ncbi:hypothetical protein ACP4OV_018775 [Aristida adscensionis]
MDMEECAISLLNRVRLLHPWNPEVIVAYIVSRKTSAEVRQLLVSDDDIRLLIIEARQQLPQLTPQPPSWGQDSRSFPHPRPQFHPVDSFQGIQAPFPLPHSRPQFHPVDSFQGIQIPFPLPHSRPQFHPSRNLPIGPPGGFQSPLPEISVLGEQFQSLSIAGDGMPYHHRIASLNVTGDSPSSSKAHTRPCHYHFFRGYCKKGERCTFAHASGPREMHNNMQVGSPGSLHMLDMEIRELLLSLRPPCVPIESLANMYIGRYGKPLRVEGFCMEGQQHGLTGYSLGELLVRLNSTRLINREGQHYIVLVEDAPVYLAHGFKLVTPDASSDSNQIYITFMSQSTFTEQDVWNYFSQYGMVNEVRLPPQKRRTFGFVSFLYPGTVKHILSERSPMTPHSICGVDVLVKAYKEKHELELERFKSHCVEKYKRLAPKIAHYISAAHEVSNANVMHHTGERLLSDHGFGAKLNNGADAGSVLENSSITIAPEISLPPTHNLPVHSVTEASPLKGENTAESSPKSNSLDEASADQSSFFCNPPAELLSQRLPNLGDRLNRVSGGDEFRLPENLDIEYREEASCYKQTESHIIHLIRSEVLSGL